MKNSGKFCWQIATDHLTSVREMKAEQATQTHIRCIWSVGPAAIPRSPLDLPIFHLLCHHPPSSPSDNSESWVLSTPVLNFLPKYEKFILNTGGTLNGNVMELWWIIHTSRSGNDKDIYNERLNLGRQIFNKVLDAINKDLRNTVFSYIPNTAEVSYFGMVRQICVS